MSFDFCFSSMPMSSSMKIFSIASLSIFGGRKRDSPPFNACLLPGWMQEFMSSMAAQVGAAAAHAHSPPIGIRAGRVRFTVLVAIA